MGLIHPWMATGILATAAAVAALTWWWRHRPAGATRAVPAAALDRVRQLPTFRTLARAELRTRAIEAGCLALAIGGVALLAGRLVGVSDDAAQLRTRDVVLCLDVSRSMAAVDGDVIDAYVELAHSLDGERIGFVMFDANAVTGFPLTTDTASIVDMLRTAKAAIADGQMPGTQATNAGSSLIGDGLTTCVQHFDRRDQERSRTVVLATDNLVSGGQVYTLEQAGAFAREAGAMVYGVMPAATDTAPRRQLEQVAHSTHGDVLALEPGEATNTAVITTTIRKQEKSALIATAQDRSYDLVWPGGLLLVVGLAGALVVGWRRP